MDKIIAQPRFNKRFKVTITKLKNRPDATGNPNPDIAEGSVYTGETSEKPIVGKIFYLDIYPNRWFHTSVVEEVIDENNFKTMNSYYHIKYED